MEDDSHPLDYYPDEETGDEATDSLVLIDKARAALAQAETLPDVGHVMAAAEAARHYARKAKLGRAAENHAIRIRLEAERKAGTLLIAMDRQQRGRPEKSDNLADFPRPKLADLGVSHRQASDWTKMATVPEEVFDAHVQEIVSAEKALTTAGVVEVAKRIEREQRRAEPKPAPDLASVPPSVRCEVGTAISLPLDDDSVHLIVTSPPYGVGIEYEDSGDVQAALWPAFMHRWLTEAYRVTIEGGRLALNVPLDTTTGGFRPTYADAVQAALDAGWTYRSSIVWDKTNLGKSTARGSIDSAAAPSIIAPVEMIALFCKEQWARTPPCPSDLGHEDWLEWTNGYWRTSPQQFGWEGHPAPFPLELPRRLIQLLSFPGDLVLDPFCGSGTTLLAAHQLGRQAIGFDRSRAYVDSTLRRLTADRGRSDAVHAGADGSGVPGPGASAGEPGGLRSGVHRGSGGPSEPVILQAGTHGVAV